MAEAQVQQGPPTVGGQSDQPLKGETTATNAALAQADQGLQQQAEQTQPTMPIQQQAPQTGPQVTGTDADLLYGPTQRPNEPVTAGAGGIAMPANITNKLQALIQAAKDPDASPALKALVQLALYHMNAGNNAPTQ